MAACLPELSVFENLAYAAYLRLPKGLTFAHHMVNVVDVIRTTMLQDCAGHKVRDLTEFESRRMALALELLNRPGIIFVDELTSVRALADAFPRPVCPFVHFTVF